MTKILLTGGTGLIGREVLKLLLDSDYEIYAIEHNAVLPKHNKINIIKADLLNNDDIKQIFNSNSFDALIHLAWYGDKKAHMHNLNYNWLESSLNLIRTFINNGGSKILCTGSVSEYDFKYGYFTEDLTPLNNKSLYGKCKTSLYEASSAYCKVNNVDFRWARIFNLFGNYEREERLIPYVINCCLKNEDIKVSDCLKFQDYLYVKDVANAFLKVFESNENGPVNICSGEPIQLKNIVSKIAELTNFRGKILWGAIPTAFEENVVVGNNAKLKALGWKQEYTLEDGLKDTIEWWKNELESK